MNIQIDRIWPNAFTLPSVFVEEKSTKYPMTVKIVDGIKLKKKHMIIPPVSEEDTAGI